MIRSIARGVARYRLKRAGYHQLCKKDDVGLSPIKKKINGSRMYQKYPYRSKFARMWRDVVGYKTGRAKITEQNKK